ncbi:MAG: insulinase family protein [Sphingobacteriales bacterium]|nr:insulinase family protein [Sphingobacteriales bacterium]
MINRTEAPQAFPLNTVQLLKAKPVTLANGLLVYTVDGADEEVIRLEIVFTSGMRAEHKKLVATATNYLLNAGTANMTSAEIMEKLDFYGAFYQHDNQLDRCSVSLYTLKKYFEETLTIFAEFIQKPTFPEEELETYIKNSIQRFEINNAKNDFRARREFHKTLFGEHPYGRKVEVDDFDELTREDIVAYHKEHYALHNAKFILSGNFNSYELNALQKAFYTFSSQEKSNIQYPKVNPVNPVIFFEERAEALQSAIRIGKQFVLKTHPDYIQLSILTTVLGGYFGSRLMTNIREDKGYTYGIGAGIYPLLDTSFFYIATEVGVDVTQKALDEIYSEIHRLTKEYIPDEELQLVKNYLKGAYIGSIENIFSHADKFKSIDLYDLDYGYYERYFKIIDETTSERLLQLAKEYFQRNTLTEVVIGKK